MSYNTPILFVIFNRLKTTKRVFLAIKKMKPKYIYISADGPRAEVKGDAEKCQDTREYVLNHIDWDCKVKTLFQKKNLGCGLGPATAITWFFKNVEEGIILEDDCVPSESFFYYCSYLLEKYRDNDKISIISGHNELGSFGSDHTDYFFTRFAGIWGWASWRRAWIKFNINVPEWRDKEIREPVLNSFSSNYFKYELEFNLNKVIETGDFTFWDYQWWFYRILGNTLGIVPAKNLVKNIGFGKGATHTQGGDHPSFYLDVNEILLPLKEPKIILPNEEYERKVIASYEAIYNSKRKKNIYFYLSAIKNKIKKLLSSNFYVSRKKK